MEKEIFVQNIKNLCELKGIKPAEACLKSGAGESLWGNLNRGRIPSIDRVQLLADYFGCTISELLGEKEIDRSPIRDSQGELTMFLQRLKKLIDSHGITKNRFLMELGLNRNAFNNWEYRGTVPSGDTLAKIADYFGVTVDYLLGRTDEKIEILKLTQEKETTAAKDGGLLEEFGRIFDTLTPENQNAVIAEMLRRLRNQ